MKCRTDEENQAIIVRLNKIEGQVNGIKKMILDDKPCMGILNQLLSVSSATKGLYQIMAAAHLHNCLDSLDKKERKEVIDEIVQNLQKLK